MTPELDWQAYGYVQSSKYRIAVIQHLGIGPATPTQLADATGEPIPHISRALRRLDDRDLVELRVPEHTKRGRVYGLTERGERVLAEIVERDSR